MTKSLRSQTKVWKLATLLMIAVNRRQHKERSLFLNIRFKLSVASATVGRPQYKYL